MLSRVFVLFSIVALAAAASSSVAPTSSAAATSAAPSTSSTSRPHSAHPNPAVARCKSIGAAPLCCKFADGDPDGKVGTENCSPVPESGPDPSWYVACLTRRCGFVAYDVVYSDSTEQALCCSRGELNQGVGFSATCFYSNF